MHGSEMCETRIDVIVFFTSFTTKHLYSYEKDNFHHMYRIFASIVMDDVCVL